MTTAWPSDPFATRPELSGTFGMVASTHWLASQCGMAVLERGGNAVDAAAATGFVLHVVEPHLNGPGGDMTLLFSRPGDALPTVLAAQGPAPAGASIAHYTGLGLELVPGTGLLAACVPGAVTGWLTLLRDHGSMRLRDVLGYAIDYAAAGHPVLPRVAATIAAMAEHFGAHWPTSAQVWLAAGQAPAAGDLVTNPGLAGTYTRLLTEAEAAGADRQTQLDAAITAWTTGFVATAIDGFTPTAQMDDSGVPHAGVLTGADLAAWRPGYEPPVTLDWHGSTVCKAGPWSQGPVLLQQLAMLAEDDLAALTAEQLVHVTTETAKLAFADREAWCGDTPDVPLADLLSPAYARARRALVGDAASLELRPGSPDGRRPQLPRWVQEGRTGALAAAGTGEPTRGDTCHIDVVDRWGSMVSATPSGGWLQSSPAVPGLGFCLGTRAQMFWLDEGLPNSLAPGKRPRTTLTPTMVARDGACVLSFGTPGGDQQEQWQLVFWLAHAVGGLDLQAAIDAPSWHTTAFPSSFHPRETVPGGIVVEARLGAEAIEALRRRGHRVEVSGDWSLGRLSAVGRDPSSGVLRAGANPRGRQGYAVGR